MDESTRRREAAGFLRFGMHMTDTDNDRRIAKHILGEGDYFSGPADASQDKYREVAKWFGSDRDSLPRPSPASDGATASAGDKNAGPRAWGFDVEALNREYALVTWGSKAVVTKERTDGPIEDRTRILSLEAFRAWFANEFTEVATADLVCLRHVIVGDCNGLNCRRGGFKRRQVIRPCSGPAKLIVHDGARRVDMWFPPAPFRTARQHYPPHSNCAAFALFGATPLGGRNWRSCVNIMRNCWLRE